MSIRRIIGAWGIVLGAFLAAGAVLALTSCIPENWDQAGGKGGGSWPWPPKGGTPPGPPPWPIPLPPTGPPPTWPPVPGPSTPAPAPIPGAPFQVTECVLGSAVFAGTPPPNTLTFRFGFSSPVNLSTMKVPETVIVYMSGDFTGGAKMVRLPSGTFYSASDGKTVVLVSGVDNPGIMSMLGATQTAFPAGVPVILIVLLLGNDNGFGVIQDSAGRVLDGNRDGRPGGDHGASLSAFLTWPTPLPPGGTPSTGTSPWGKVKLPKTGPVVFKPGLPSPAKPFPGPGTLLKMPLQVTECALGTAPFVPPLPPKTLAFRFGFSDAVDVSTMMVEDTVRILMKGEFQGGQRQNLPSGRFYGSPDGKTVVLVSGLDNYGILVLLGATGGGIHPAGKSVSFTVTLRGTPLLRPSPLPSSGVIKGTAGGVLDGDGDVRPGGNYETVLNASLRR